MQGKVKWFNNEKGYGFIEYAELSDIFVHYSAIVKDGYKTLTEGSLVNFKLIETAKGLQAIDVVEEEKAIIGWWITKTRLKNIFWFFLAILYNSEEYLVS